ncbi:hypothetical protein [Carboxylicivirga marina]|uniref:Fimbrillin family protein n=1 Tax=Carboxylicivirga marina TaxID=2800988 RepID=A0ABS1HH23_9BACT|nr:hypothetical protein [Carboxylicivirga marina]MBK3516957.1 hypothetical protein [Carboxylicivirga marina]
MKKLFFVAIAMMALIACDKTDDVGKDLRGDIRFNINTGTAQEDLKGAVAPGVLPVYVNSLSLTATPLNGNVPVSDVFSAGTVADPSEVTLANVWYGQNTFTATTTPLYFTDLADPDFNNVVRPAIKSAIGLNNVNVKMVDPVNGMFCIRDSHPGSTYTTTEMSGALRQVPPYVEFTGETTAVINHEFEQNNGDITIDMGTENGRLITTFEFEDAGAKNYYAKLFYNDGNVEKDISVYLQYFIAGANKSALYWSGVNAIDGAKMSLRLEIYSSEDTGNDPSNHVKVNEFNLMDPAVIDQDILMVDKGVDKWVKIVVSEDAIKTESPLKSMFTWDWTTDDSGDVVIGANN